jgi:hypothetical protein
VTNKLVASFSLKMAERSEAKSENRSFVSKKNLNFDFRSFAFLVSLRSAILTLASKVTNKLVTLILLKMSVAKLKARNEASREKKIKF